MKNILVTGATGNIGVEVIRFLAKMNTSNRIIAGVRNIERAKTLFQDIPALEYLYFDFEDPQSYNTSLSSIDCVFLLRPPHLSDIDTYFKPLIQKFKDLNINEVVFLSVQGVEKSKVIPHNKIEALIKKVGLNYIFLRPSYFMQNLTTTLLSDIKTKRELILPAGSAKFNWIDIENIGEVAAILLDRLDSYKNSAFELTGYENENFYTVVNMINEVVENPIRYRNINPFGFYRLKKKQGMLNGLIIVMILLHFLPRFQNEPRISDFYERLTGKRPTDLRSFIKREKNKFQ